jgi:hypothetical protein
MSNKGQDNEIIKLLRRSLNTSLINTKPLIAADTTAYEDVRGYAIYCLDEATFNTSGTLFEGYEGTNPNTLTMKAGHTWYIKVKNLKLATGTVFVYRD